jgi:hypothetical protein
LKITPSYDAYLEEDDDPVTGCFPRSDTADLRNDPRMFVYNVINKRLEAFQTIVVSSILLAGTSLSYIFDVEVHLEKWTIGAGYISCLLMALVFMMNMFTVLVLTLQFYQVFRLMTSGPTGFEASKDYYTTATLMEMRHLAVRFFSWSLPAFIIAIAFKVCDKWVWRRAMPVMVYLALAASFCCVCIVRLNNAFSRMYNKCKRYETLQFQRAREEEVKTTMMSRARNMVTGQ